MKAGQARGFMAGLSASILGVLIILTLLTRPACQALKARRTASYGLIQLQARVSKEAGHDPGQPDKSFPGPAALLPDSILEILASCSGKIGIRELRPCQYGLEISITGDWKTLLRAMYAIESSGIPLASVGFSLQPLPVHRGMELTLTMNILRVGSKKDMKRKPP